jgi:hypothetical protein
MEITQGIQCFDQNVGDAGCEDNSVPLLANRATVVRVYVTAGMLGEPEGGLGHWIWDVTAKLFIRRQGDDEPGIPMWPANGPISWDSPARGETLDQKRSETDGTLNFRLPDEWLAGRVVLQAQVNPDWACGPYESEENRANNWLEKVAEFQEHDPLTIKYLSVEFDGEEPAGRVEDAGEWLQKVWPVGDEQLTYRRLEGEGLRVDYNPYVDSFRLIDDLNETYMDLVYAWLDGGPYPPRILFGWVPDVGDSDLHGLSDRYGSLAVAWYKDKPERFEKGLVHESGHNFLQDHYDHAIAECGFDVAEMQVKHRFLMDAMCCDPGMTFDTSGSWISPAIFKSIFEARRIGTWSTIPLSRRAAPRDYALIRGKVWRDQTGTIEPVYRVSSTAVVPNDGPPPGSEYCVQFLVDDGTVLSSRCFDASFVNYETGEALDRANFFLIEQYPAGTARIRLMKEQSVLDERVVSRNAPVVTVLTPNGGEKWDATHTITWQASDADGDALTYSVFYSPDDGQSWRRVATGLDEQHVQWDTSLAGGGQKARVRVVVTDGINTSSDDSDGSFYIGLKGPSAHITFPQDQRTFRRPEAILLQGQGYDPEDGELRGDALVWSSDRDGVLGTGNHILTPELSRGWHAINLTATDSDGTTSTSSVMLHVGHRLWMPLIQR